MNIFKYLAGLGVIALIGCIVFLYSGIYPMGADVPHNSLIYWTLETLREKSIARAAKNIDVPKDLNTPMRLLAGGADYNDMCAGCHLKPSKTQSDMSVGLYPAPPNLSVALSAHEHSHDNNQEQGDQQPLRRQFWIIKHGIKASGMPAWGSTHDDQRIWNMVAFLQKLPGLSPDQYQILTARGEDDNGHH